MNHYHNKSGSKFVKGIFILAALAAIVTGIIAVYKLNKLPVDPLPPEPVPIPAPTSDSTLFEQCLKSNFNNRTITNETHISKNKRYHQKKILKAGELFEDGYTNLTVGLIRFTDNPRGVITNLDFTRTKQNKHVGFQVGCKISFLVDDQEFFLRVDNINHKKKKAEFVIYSKDEK